MCEHRELSHGAVMACNNNATNLNGLCEQHAILLSQDMQAVQQAAPGITSQDKYVMPDSGMRAHNGKMALHDMPPTAHDMLPSEIFVIKGGKLVKTTVAEQLGTGTQQCEIALRARTRQPRDRALVDTGASIFLLPQSYESVLQDCAPSKVRISQATGAGRKGANVTGRAHVYFPGKTGGRGVSITMQAHTMQGLNQPLFSVHGLLKTKLWKLCLDFNDDESFLIHKRDPSLVIPIYWAEDNNCWEIIFWFLIAQSLHPHKNIFAISGCESWSIQYLR